MTHTQLRGKVALKLNWKVFNFPKLIFIALLLFQSANQLVANDCIVLNHLHNMIDSLLINADTAAALIKYEEAKDLDCYQMSYHDFEFAKILVSQRKFRKAKEEITIAIDKGYIAPLIFYSEEKEFTEWVSKYFSDDFARKMMSRTLKKIDSLLIQKKSTMMDYLDILSVDQGLRRIEFINRVKYRASTKRWKIPAKDSILSSEVVDNYSQYFSSRDSINLQKFVNKVIDLGFLPDERDHLGLIPTQVLIVHSAKFEFGDVYEQILLNGLKTGRISSKTYGWYIDHKREYKLQKPFFHYVKDEEHSSSETIRINNLRHQYGIRRLPATIWNRNIY